MAEAKTILVVDDDPTNLEIIIELLEDEGFNILKAQNGKEALNILETTEHAIKLLVLDWMMPEMSGIELLEIIKTDSRFKEIPVIMQTAKAYSEDMVTGIEKGATQYLTKPFSKDVLLSMVNSTLEKHEQFDKMSERVLSQKKMIRETAASILKREELMKFDLNTYQTFNDFFMKSLTCKDHDEIATLLLETANRFSFKSSGEKEEDRKLRCSIRLASEKEVNVSDRGMDSSMDKMILQKAMESDKIIQSDNYTALASKNKRTAILIRNTPTDEEEAGKAINIISILLEMFEQRLMHFENELAISNKNSALEKKNSQITHVIRCCSTELDNVNKTYQQMKERQMELMEVMANTIIAGTPGLNDTQQEQIKAAVGSQLMKLMDLYSADQITDQTFLLTIQELKKLLPEQLGGASQDSIDELLASLRM